jgi:hypothetical protein
VSEPCENPPATQVWLDAKDLQDLREALQMRIDALADARPGFKCPMRTRTDITFERLTRLQITLESAQKRVAQEKP